MRCRTIVSLGLLFAAIALPSSDSSACSVVTGYLPPSNYELVTTTDRIVLAQATGYAPTCRTAFDVVESIKGDDDATPLVLEGCSQREEGEARMAETLPPLIETSFQYARNNGGSCVAGTFEQGATYLLFLARHEGRWVLRGVPFTRVAEQVSGSDSPWVRAVQQYAQIDALDDYDAEQRALRALAGSSANPAISPPLAADLADHFARISNQKSYADLLALYEGAEDEDRRTEVLWAWANRGDPEAKPLFDALLAEGRADGPVAGYFEKIDDKGSIEQLAEAFYAARDVEKNWYARFAPLHALLGLADDRHVALVLRVYADAREGDESTTIEEWLALHPSRDAQPALRERTAHGFVKARSATFALAASGDADVAQWAAESASVEGEDRWVALYALASSPLASADAAIGDLIDQHDERLVTLVQGYGNSVSPFRSARLREIVALPGKSKDLDRWLWRTITEMKEAGRLEQADELLAALPAEARFFYDE
jgi:hypothetical protein